MHDHQFASSSTFQTLDLGSLDDATGGLRRPGRLGLFDCRYEGPHDRPYGDPYGGRPPSRATHVTGSSLGSDLSSVASVVSTVLPVVIGLL